MAATICLRPVTLTFDLLTLKSVWESHVPKCWESIHLSSEDPDLYKYFQVSNSCFMLQYRDITQIGNIIFISQNQTQYIKLSIYSAEFTRKWLLCIIIIISIAVLSNILMTLYLQPFARWQLSWCSPQYAAAPWPWLLTFWPWSRCGSRMWPGVPLCKVSSS